MKDGPMNSHHKKQMRPRIVRWHFAFLLLTGGVVVGFSLSATTAIAQSQDARLKHFTVNDGLPFGNIRALAQDSTGFLWIGTNEGLYRHDGYAFVPYRHDPDDPHSLTDDVIWGLHVDRQGQLWVSTFQGLDRYDPGRDAFMHLRHDPEDTTSLSSDSVRVVLEDRRGTLWVGTWGGGLNRLDREADAFTVYFHDAADPTSLGSDYVRVLYEDQDGMLWVGTRDGGLNRFDPDTETFSRHVHAPGDVNSLVSNSITAIHEDAAGHLWIGTTADGLHRMDAERQGRFIHYPLSFGLGSTAFIHASRDGTVWAASSNCCLERYDPITDTFHSQGLPTVLAFSAAQSIHEARDGTLWFGAGEGLKRYDPPASPVRFIRYAPPLEQSPLATAVMEDQAGMLWIGGGQGLLRYDRKTDRSTWYLPDSEDPRSLHTEEINTITQILEDREGTLWVGAGTVLSKLDRATGSFTHYRHDPQDETSLSEGSFFDIKEDEEGNLWIAMVGFGINKFDPRTGQFTRFSLRKDGIAGSPQTLRIARDGAIWIGLSNGLARFNLDTKTFTEFKPLANADPRIGADVHVLYEDREGRIWYGAPHVSSGIKIFDPRTETFSFLPSEAEAIYGIEEDLQGNIWIHADDRVLMYDPESETFRSFDEGSGLTGWPAILATFGASTHRGASGELFFGVVGGVMSFLPEEVLASKASDPPSVALTELTVFSEPVPPSDEGPLDASIWAAERVRLQHGQNTFSFSFAALDFRNPEANQYRYQLENYDETWREAGSGRRASYVKVPPGNYVFRVQAANSDGVWNEEGASVAVVVLPPWWRTTWAYLLYGLLLVIGVVFVDRVQRRRLVARERERARERELEQARHIERAHTELTTAHEHLKATQQQLVHAEKMASLGALTAGIAHEIKNPLNFVNNFASLARELVVELKEETDPDEIQAILSDLDLNTKKIEEHGQRADGIVRSMMQHARAGSGEREMVDLNALVAEHIALAYHGKRAQIPDFNAEIERDLGADVGKVEVVPQDLGRVLLNLLGNAFDAVRERAAQVNGQYAPTVKISTRRVGDAVEIRVADNGSGIAEEVREKIFEPFFTTKPTGSGTGLGLSLSYDIVTQGHGGTLTVESEEGEGSHFIILLP